VNNRFRPHFRHLNGSESQAEILPIARAPMVEKIQLKTLSWFELMPAGLQSIPGSQIEDSE
jgi:hypothetical protein